MLNVKFTTNFAGFADDLRSLGRQGRFAAAIALTESAQAVREAEYAEMRDVFDRPTPYTLRSLFLRRATPNDLRAIVWLKDEGGEGTPATEYLRPQIEGGTRNLKRFELALRQKGLLPPGMIAVPASGAKLDSYGNMSRGQIVQILAYFRTFGEQGFKANITEAGRRKLARGTKKKQGIAYFAGRPGDGKLPLGIWQRTYFAVGSAIKPVLLFVDEAHYERRFDFFYVARRAHERAFPAAFERAYARALATARSRSGSRIVSVVPV